MKLNQLSFISIEPEFLAADLSVLGEVLLEGTDRVSLFGLKFAFELGYHFVRFFFL